MKPVFLTTLFVILAALRLAAQDAVVLNLPNGDLRELFALYERLTGAHIIIDSAAGGFVPLSTKEAVPPEKAIQLIEMALFANGFSIVQTQPDTIQVLSPSRSPRSEALPVLTTPEQLPKAERVVSYVFKLKHRDAVDIAQILQVQLDPTQSGLPTIIPASQSRSVVVTARSSVLRELIRLVGELDVARQQ